MHRSRIHWLWPSAVALLVVAPWTPISATPVQTTSQAEVSETCFSTIISIPLAAARSEEVNRTEPNGSVGYWAFVQVSKLWIVTQALIKINCKSLRPGWIRAVWWNTLCLWWKTVKKRTMLLISALWLGELVGRIKNDQNKHSGNLNSIVGLFLDKRRKNGIRLYFFYDNQNSYTYLNENRVLTYLMYESENPWKTMFWTLHWKRYGPIAIQNTVSHGFWD